MAGSRFAPYDALLLLSFGGPEGPDDVVPFLRNVTRGRGIPDERLAVVGEHYGLFGGRSPINDQNRALLAALQAELGDDLPVYWGNRNWAPYLADTLRQMESDGIKRAAVFVTSAYSSYSGCRQYREDLARGLGESGASIELDRLRAYFNHPGFVAPMLDNTIAAIEALGTPQNPHVVFVTHSVPESYNRTSGPEGGAYLRQHESVAEALMAEVRERAGRDLPHSLVFCSRSGAPGVPWLEPDINDHLRELRAAGVDAVAVVPIGFVSDHMEVVYDLDIEASATAAGLGLGFERAATCGTDSRFVAAIVDLVDERAARERAEHREQRAIGDLPAPWDLCLSTCCPNPRAPLPTVGER